MRWTGYGFAGLALALASGCQSMSRLGAIDAPPPVLPESARAIGRLPGIDPTHYAYSFYKGTATQVYPFQVADVTTSTLDALAELGFREVKVQYEGQSTRIDALTVDSRPSAVTIKPQYANSLLTLRIGGCGDEPASKAVIDRVALHFGVLPRVMIPLEASLARRTASTSRYAPSGSTTAIISIPSPEVGTPGGHISLPAPAETPGPFTPEGPESVSDRGRVRTG